MRLIDADAVLERIERDCDARCLYKDYEEPVRSKMCNCCGLGDARMYVEDAPTVDTERHGYWKKIGTYKAIVPICKCSFCHTPFMNVYLKERYHHCPHCGAKMDLVDQESEE